MILHNVLADLDKILSEVTPLIDLYKNKEFSFYKRSLKWFEKLEKFSDDNQWIIKAEIASLRGKVITASRVQPDDTFDWMPKSKNRRRAKEALTAECINLAVSLTMTFVQQDRELQAEASNILRQIIASGVSKGLIDSRPRLTIDSQFVQQSWSVVASDPELAPMCTHVIGLIGAYNAYMLFDKAFGDIFFNGQDDSW